MKDYMTLTEIGHIYGVSSHMAGKWLKGLGLRTSNGQPSEAARSERYVVQSPSRQPGTYFYIWDSAKTTRLLDMMCYPRSEPTTCDHQVNSVVMKAFSVRESGSCGQEIVNPQGLVIAWTVDRVVADRFVKIMNECDQQSA